MGTCRGVARRLRGSEVITQSSVASTTRVITKPNSVARPLSRSCGQGSGPRPGVRRRPQKGQARSLTAISLRQYRQKTPRTMLYVARRTYTDSIDTPGDTTCSDLARASRQPTCP